MSQAGALIPQPPLPRPADQNQDTGTGPPPPDLSYLPTPEYYEVRARHNYFAHSHPLKAVCRIDLKFTVCPGGLVRVSQSEVIFPSIKGRCGRHGFILKHSAAMSIMFVAH